MEANVKLYAYNYAEAKTYLWAMVFVACNLILPQVFHLIPQGGIIFAPLSFVILAGAYKFGWKTGLLAALASPLVNHAITGMPAWEVMPVMTLKLAVIALVAGLAAQRFKTISLPLIIAVVLVSMALGALGELAHASRTSSRRTVCWKRYSRPCPMHSSMSHGAHAGECQKHQSSDP